MKFRHFYFLSFIALIIFTNCKETNTKKDHSTLNNDTEPYNLDLILKCGYFSYNDNFFVTADNGCIYKQDERNDLGNIAIYLIPKETKNIQLNKVSDYEEYVNSLNTTNLKKEFHIYLYLIPKEYLVKTPEGYYQKQKYIEQLYTFNDDLKEWNLLSSKNINSIEEEQKNIKEVSLFITQEIKNKQGVNSEIIETRDYLLELYESRNPLPIYKLNDHYLDSLIQAHPPNKSNIDIYCQVDFFLGFLDSRFNNEYFESDYSNIEPSEDAFKYIEHPFNYADDDINFILEKVKQKSNDSLWVKYYLNEEYLNSVILHRDKEILKNIQLYQNLLILLKMPPLYIIFPSTTDLINNIKKKKENIKQWQGTYSFGFGFRGNDDNYEMSFKLKSDEAIIVNHKGIERAAEVIRVTGDTLELRDKESRQYILYRKNSGNNYAITGHDVYLLNPPNDHYLLTKEE